MHLDNRYLGSAKRARVDILLQYYALNLVFRTSSDPIRSQAPCRSVSGDQWLVGDFIDGGTLKELGKNKIVRSFLLYVSFFVEFGAGNYCLHPEEVSI